MSAAAGALGAITAGPFTRADETQHPIPADKKLSPDWIAALYERGESTWYAGDDLTNIGMPIGGVCAGQVYLTGDGRLIHWDVFNQKNFTGYGATNYQSFPKPHCPLQQGAAVEVVLPDGKRLRRTLDRDGFPNVRFCGEYPIATVDYGDDFPLSIVLTAFSPFIPLNAADSAIPCTILRYRVKNRSDSQLSGRLAVALENGVARFSGQTLAGKRTNRVLRRKDDPKSIMVLSRAEATPPAAEPRPPVVLADFEGNDYGDWQVEGDAFGKRPATGTLPNQQEVSGFEGKGLVNTYLGGDQPHGKLVSPEFTIDRAFISFLIGGGSDPERTCIRLLVDGKVVRTAAGQNNERLMPHNWDVREFAGKRARIEIVDEASGGWGHINIDQIELRDVPRSAPAGPLEAQADFGTMALAVLESDDSAFATAVVSGELDAMFASLDEPAAHAEASFGNALVGAAGGSFDLAPGEEAVLSVVVAWHFPNRPQHGNYYANRFADAAAVVEYVREHFDRLVGETQLWHDTWYDSTLPHWLLDRLFSTVSTLATGTCQWWANGRFWAWEGVGCCRGTCAHVWNYEHAMARLFPELERSVREMQDFNPEAGFDEATGAVRFRGEDWKLWAGDSQGGTVLKAYREHQCSPDDAFLRRNWPRIRKTLEFLFTQDGDANGLLEGSQHNTYDINFFGPNTMIGSLYLAACLAAKAMAEELGDREFAETCERIYRAGRDATVRELFDGEYFIQKVDLTAHPDFQYAEGCLSDQLFGQGWAHQVGLGYVYPPETVRSALEAIWKYNWTPDVGPYNAEHKPERWFARAGQAGLFTCTWPKKPYGGGKPVRYRNEVWTGIEYQVAGNMVWDGMLTEALAICRGIHERYHPRSHNPWNEVECGDHYARGMASYGVFLALCGFRYHGPKGVLGFAPKFPGDRFQAAFTGAEGWGSIAQTRDPSGQTNSVEVRWGRLRLTELVFDVPGEGTIVEATLGDRPIEATVVREGTTVHVRLREPIVVERGETLRVRFPA
ncbi:hypothetical protein JCM19992_02510 [Thermostilla marina]